MTYRPITPPRGSHIRIRKDQHPQTEFARRNPWTVCTRHPGEPGYTQVVRTTSWDNTIRFVREAEREGVRQ